MKFKPKLIRDKIIELIEKDGVRAATHIAEPEEYKFRLKEKLQEEVTEFLKSDDPEELADIIEVIYALAQTQNISSVDLEKIRKKKADEKGIFKKKLILDKIEEK